MKKLRPLLPRIPSYIKDIAHFLNLMMGKKLNNEDLIVQQTHSLYTQAYHRMKALVPLVEE